MGMTRLDRTYDAIVIGSGISGGWAAKELCDHGLKTLVLERGRDVQHIKDYPTANMAPWELPHRGYSPRKLIDENPLISKATTRPARRPAYAWSMPTRTSTWSSP